MGQALNKIVSLTSREVKSFNLERRAQKVISQDKPIPAPKLPSTVKELERLKEENVSTEYLHKKDEKLDEFLRKVYVSSSDPAPPLERKINPDRPLPVKRTTETGISYGYSESEEATIPEGKVSLKQALTFISQHESDKKKYSSAAIASEYKISLADTNDILEHFKMFSVRVQKKEPDPDSMSTYERLQYKVKNMTSFNATEILKEIKQVYGKELDKEDKSIVGKRPENSDLTNITVHVKGQEKKNAQTIVKSEKEQNNHLEAEGKLENSQQESNVKTDENTKKQSSRKQSQENG